ncbi:hypothetical protein [Psittacid alphaherpesvirus 1]|uniref:Uncharacterized protein ORFC n=1 Tax=Psittacid herpesvirus 1 (isolate Amazon parrot/-/97-0001/1997) TaxID=670426 RepID=ORFC_PSHV1|nr:protein IC [Psittacid alphaherpesvirus 1]Q6UDL3.1 RecName: Full=Uncharacterized protein ORFC [Psittacid herpesvirus 1 Amazon parrot/1997]AAQ73697.1 hypothetical protein [Psittacid alphaherpesvirus 1]
MNKILGLRRAKSAPLVPGAEKGKEKSVEETGFMTLAGRLRRGMQRLSRRGYGDNRRSRGSENNEQDPQPGDKIASPQRRDYTKSEASCRPGSGKTSPCGSSGTPCSDDAGGGRNGQENSGTRDTPCWMYKDSKSRYRVGVTPDLIPTIFGVSEVAASGLPRCRDKAAKRQPQSLLSPGVEALLVTIAESLETNGKRVSGRTAGKLWSWRVRDKAPERDYRNVTPTMFEGSCFGKPIRAGVFNAPRAYLDDLLGDHYFVPYLRRLPRDFTREETLSLRVATEAAVFANMLWEARHKNNFGAGVSYYPGALASATGTAPDFTDRGRSSLDSPYFASTFLPGIFVILPPGELPIDFMRLAVLLAVSAIETCVTTV